MKNRVLILVFGVLLVSPQAAGQMVADFQFFPVVARTAGAGVPPTQWVTDLVINNVTAETVVVGFQFFEEKKKNTFDPTFPDRVTLEPRETIVLEDVLSYWTGLPDNIKGSLLLTCDADMLPGAKNTDDAVILATTRTYNVGDPAGTYGQTVPSLPLLISIFPHPMMSFVTGARNDADFRSNLGIVSPSPESITVHYRIMVGNGVILATGQKTLKPFSMRQWSFASLGIGTVDGPMTVDLWLDPASASPNPCELDLPNGFMAYVSKVDGNPNGTGDGEFIYATPGEMEFCDD
jgi:hypothetical protein